MAQSGPGTAVVELRYPAPIENRDLTWRPRRAPGQRAELLIGDRRVTVKAGDDGRFRIEGRPGSEVVLRSGALRDRYRNRNGNRMEFEL